MIQVAVFACFALIRRWRANCLQFSFPTRGKAFVGDPYNEDVTPIPGDHVTHTSPPSLKFFEDS